MKFSKLIFTKFIFVASVLVLFSSCDSSSEKFSTYDQKVENSVVEFDGNSYRLGLIPVSDKEYKSFPKLLTDFSKATIPSSVDLSSDLPNVGNQGSQGSCTAWATGYAYKTFQERLDRGWNVKNDTSHQFSPAYIYNQINGGQDQGSHIYRALQLIVDQGCATLSSMPYNQNNYWTQPNSSQRANAANYKAQSWWSLTDGSVSAMKNHIANGDCLVVGVPVYPDFNVSSSNPVYDNTNGTLGGYHAITFVGYDDSKQAFKFINSWGTHWGFNGYGWMSYDLISSLGIRAYVMKDINDVNPDPDPDPDPVPSTNLALNKPASASDSYSSSYGPEKAFDGDTTSTRWIANDNGDHTWITVDLGSNKSIKSLRVIWSLTNYAARYNLYIRTSSGSWQNLGSLNSNGGEQILTISSSVTARYVSLSLDYSPAAYFVLYEMEVYADDYSAVDNMMTSSNSSTIDIDDNDEIK